MTGIVIAGTKGTSRTDFQLWLSQVKNILLRVVLSLFFGVFFGAQNARKALGDAARSDFSS